MSTYRGFSTYLLSRIDRAHNTSHYFDADTLRFFGAYGGLHSGLHSGLDPARRLATVVESVMPPDGARRYRFVAVLFTPHDDGGETVDIWRPEGDTYYSNGATAGRRMAAWLRDVAERVERGETIDAATGQTTGETVAA